LYDCENNFNKIIHTDRLVFIKKLKTTIMKRACLGLNTNTIAQNDVSYIHLLQNNFTTMKRVGDTSNCNIANSLVQGLYKPYKWVNWSKGTAIVLFLLAFSGCKAPVQRDVADKDTMKVTTFRVISSGKNVTFDYSGTIEAYQVIPLTFQVSGIVDMVYAKEGDHVNRGQLLATIDKSDLENIYQASLAKYQQAKDAYDRLKSVHDEGSLPEIKWVEMVSNLQQAESAKEIAKNNLNKSRLVAPVDGFIGRRNIEPGQSSVLLTSAPFELVKIEKVYVKIAVPENEVNKIRVGQKAVFSVAALDNKTFEGIINSISPVADVLSRTYTVKVLANNPSLMLKPGMVCDVSIPVEGNIKQLLIPYRAVSTDDNGNPYVYVINEGTKRVSKQNIEIGNYSDSHIIVLSGLTEGSLIVVDGKEKLSNNQLISY
jgi:RND family efflux transporter MFP subunit